MHWVRPEGVSTGYSIKCILPADADAGADADADAVGGRWSSYEKKIQDVLILARIALGLGPEARDLSGSC